MLENWTFWKIALDFPGGDALNSVAYELYDLLDLLRSIGSVYVDCTEALLTCDSLTPSLLIQIHTANMVSSEYETKLLLILVSLKTKYNKYFTLLQFVDGDKVTEIWNTLYLLNSWRGTRWRHMGHGIWDFCSVLLLHKPYRRAYHSCWFPVNDHSSWDLARAHLCYLLKKSHGEWENLV